MGFDVRLSSVEVLLETELVPSYGPTLNQLMSSTTTSVWAARQSTAALKSSDVPPPKWPNHSSAPGRDIVHDLQHGGAFRSCRVGSLPPMTLQVDDIDRGRQIAGRFRRGHTANAV